MKCRWLLVGLLFLVLVVGTWLILSIVPRPNPIGPKEIAALAKQGSEGVPQLMRILQTPDSAIEKINRYVWPYLPARFPIHIPDPNQTTRNRVGAANVLGRMGEKARPAIPALIAALRDRESDVSITAAMALRNLGPMVIPVLEQAVKSQDEQVRDRATWALQEVMPAAWTAT